MTHSADIVAHISCKDPRDSFYQSGPAKHPGWSLAFHCTHIWTGPSPWPWCIALITWRILRSSPRLPAPFLSRFDGGLNGHKMSWGIWQQLKHWRDVVWDDLMPGKTREQCKHFYIKIPLNRWDAIISHHNWRLISVVQEFDSQSWTCALGVRRNIFISRKYLFSFILSKEWIVKTCVIIWSVTCRCPLTACSSVSCGNA